MNKRVAVTGISFVSPYGDKQATIWKALQGIPSIGKLPEEFNRCQTHIGGIVPNIEEMLTSAFPKEARRFMTRWNRHTQFALSGTHQALGEHGAKLLAENGRIKEQYQFQTGTAIGTGIGSSEIISRLAQQYDQLPHDITSDDYATKWKAMKKEHLVTAVKVLPDSCAFAPSLIFGAKGPMDCGIKACATGAGNIRRAAMEILHGSASIMIAGGTESLAPVDVTAFNLLGKNGALSRRNNDPEHASRPCDQNHDGFVPSEGAGIVILEERTHAMKRGVPILAELIGFGETSDGAGSTDPNLESQIRCIRMAMDMARNTANLDAGGIQLIKAHSTSTPPPQNRDISADGVELQALKAVFGKELSNIPITTLKALLGHTLGASGSLEAGLAIESMRRGLGIPNMNIENLILQAEGLNIIRKSGEKIETGGILANSFGFGGQNVTLVFYVTA